MLTSPYNFVPLNKYVYSVKYGKQVSHDIPFEDGEDGIIEIELTNVSPLFIRNGHLKDKDKDHDYDFSSFVGPKENGKRQYFIPATTLKGAIRNVMEVLSFAKMDRVDDAWFGYRDISSRDYQDKIRNVRCGWLRKEGEKYLLSPCEGEIGIISHEEIRSVFPKFSIGKDHETAQEKQESLKTDNELYPYINGGNIVCTGFMNKKSHEYIFPIERGYDIDIPLDVFTSFDTVHAHSPYYMDKGKNGFLRQRLMNGYEIPVFYKIENENVVNMGITRNYRYPYSQNIKSLIHQEDANIDLPSVIFGYTSKDESLKGRVHFGHAFCNKLISDIDCIEKKGVLGEPRPSYFPLYIQQDGINKYVNYSSPNASIAGRKRYRIRRGNSVAELPQGNGNDSLMTNFRPIPSGHTFTCRIAVHNLKKIEIGALLSSITFNETEGTYHNIGTAKPQGYGKMKCEIKKLIGFKYDSLEYYKAFETEICSFLYSNTKSTISNNESINKLISIASEHVDESSLKMMEFTEYEVEKKGNSILKEPNSKIKVHIDESEIYKLSILDSYSDAFIKIENLIEEKKYMDALKSWNELDNKLSIYSINSERLQNMKSRILDALTHIESNIQTTSISDSLEEFIGKVDKLPTFSGKMKKWMKEKGEINDTDIALLSKKCLDILISMKEKERILWKEEKKWISLSSKDKWEDVAKDIFNNIKDKF